MAQYAAPIQPRVKTAKPRFGMARLLRYGSGPLVVSEAATTAPSDFLRRRGPPNLQRLCSRRLCAKLRAQLFPGGAHLSKPAKRNSEYQASSTTSLLAGKPDK